MRFKHILQHYEVKIWLAAMDLDVSDIEESVWPSWDRGYLFSSADASGPAVRITQPKLLNVWVSHFETAWVREHNLSSKSQAQKSWTCCSIGIRLSLKRFVRQPCKPGTFLTYAEAIPYYLTLLDHGEFELLGRVNDK